MKLNFQTLGMYFCDSFFGEHMVFIRLLFDSIREGCHVYCTEPLICVHQFEVTANEVSSKFLQAHCASV